MNTYFSNAPVWLEPTPAIRALAHRQVHIRRDSDSDLWMLTVEMADPKGSLSGRCTVKATYTGTAPTMRTVMSHSDSPVEPKSWIRQEYLRQDALRLLATPDAGNSSGELTLMLPDTQ
jgi:hypothetical protein